MAIVNCASSLTYRYKKWSKLLETHRYNRLSLLTSAPGEVRRSWSFKTYSDCKGRNNLSFSKFFRNFFYKKFFLKIIRLCFR